jgi:hypothetical protein
MQMAANAIATICVPFVHFDQMYFAPTRLIPREMGG